MPTEYTDLVEKYRSGYLQTSKELVSVGMKAGADWSSQEFSDLIIKLREYAQFDTFDASGPADMAPLRYAEDGLTIHTDNVLAALKGILEQIKVPGSSALDLDKQLRVQLKLLIDIVRVAENAVGRTPADRGGEAVTLLVRAMQQAPATLASASEVLALLVSQLSNLTKQYMTPATCPSDLSAMGDALKRLQQWEGLPGDQSIIEQIVLLEQLLLKTSNAAAPGAASSSADVQGSPGRQSSQSATGMLQLLAKHQSRVQNVSNVICKQIDQVGACQMLEILSTWQEILST